MELIESQLISTEYVTPYLGVFKFKLSKSVEYQSGQYFTLGLRRKGLEGPGIKSIEGRGLVLRPYSVSSAPFEETLELYVAWVQSSGRRSDGMGQLTTELFNPTEDLEYLFIPKARGKFYLSEDERAVIMVATGTGLAPFISHLRTAEREQSKRKFILIHGVSKSQDLAYAQELESLKAKLDLTIISTVSREDAPNKLANYAEELFFKRESSRSGRVSEEELEEAIQKDQIQGSPIQKVLDQPLLPEHCSIMMCGNPAMIEHITLIARSQGFQDKTDIIVEQYW